MSKRSAIDPPLGPSGRTDRHPHTRGRIQPLIARHSARISEQSLVDPAQQLQTCRIKWLQLGYTLAISLLPSCRNDGSGAKGVYELKPTGIPFRVRAHIYRHVNSIATVGSMDPGGIGGLGVLSLFFCPC